MDKLAPDEKKLVDDISEYGWHVINVEGDDNKPNFSYSVGLYKTFKAPEVIIIGLPLEVGQEIINLIGDDIAEGKKYKKGKYYHDIIEGYDCFLTEVENKFYKEYFGYAIWYYKGEKFPVLQCIYPDQENSYPWDWSDEDQVFQPVLGEEGEKN